MGEKTVLATGFYPELWVQADFVGQLLTRFSHLSQLTKKKMAEKRRKGGCPSYTSIMAMLGRN